MFSGDARAGIQANEEVKTRGKKPGSGKVSSIQGDNTYSGKKISYPSQEANEGNDNASAMVARAGPGRLGARGNNQQQ